MSTRISGGTSEDTGTDSRASSRRLWRKSLAASVALHGTLASIAFAVPVILLAGKPRTPGAIELTLEQAALPPEPPPPEEPSRKVEVERTEEPIPEVEPVEAPLPVEPIDDPVLEQVDLVEVRPMPLEPLVKPRPEPVPETVLEEPLVVEPVEASVVEAFTAPRKLADHCPKPDYPKRAYARRWEGTVWCRITVGADGVPTKVEIEESSGYDVLDDEVVATVLEHWRFDPARRGGRAIEWHKRMRFEFKLTDRTGR